MAQVDDDTDTEKPLDPAVARVQARLRGMMLWSRGIMLVGFAALFGVIFYKFYWVRQSVPPADTLTVLPGQSPLANLVMPAGGHITDARTDANRLVVTIDAPAMTSVLVIDLETMRTLRRLDFNKAS
jgi:type II secretory pathway component PulM